MGAEDEEEEALMAGSQIRSESSWGVLSGEPAVAGQEPGEGAHRRAMQVGCCMGDRGQR